MDKVTARVLVGDNRKRLMELPDGCVQTVVTSPPYWGLRDYGQGDQIGLETSPDDFVEELCKVFDEVWRVLADDGTLWLNLGDSYTGSGKGRNPDGTVHVSALMAKQGSSAGTVMGDVFSGLVPDGLKRKELVGIPWRVAFALQKRGWYLRQDIIWAKPNPMPESVTDRCTKSHEYIFLLSKNAKYFFDNEAIKEPVVTADGGKGIRFGGNKYGNSDDPKHATKSGNVYEGSELRNKRDVWTVTTSRYADAHFATYPPELILPCVLDGSKVGDIVLDPFSGSGTTGQVALQNGRNYIGCELNPEYAQLSLKRIDDAVGLFGEVFIE